MIALILLAVLVPCALVAGYYVGRHENRTVLDASKAVSAQTEWVVKKVSDWAPTVEALDEMSKRLDLHREAVNHLASKQDEFIQQAYTILGINKDAAQARYRATIDPDAEQVGEAKPA